MINRYFADISSNNPEFDAAAYRDAGHVLVAIKATEGATYVNPRYLQWVIEAHRHGVAVVHYHYARPDLNPGPAAEVRHFLDTVLHHTGPHDYLALDIERATPSGWVHDPSWSYVFDRQVQIDSRFRTILYISQEHLDLTDAWLYGDDRRLWIPNWSTNPVHAPEGYAVAFRQFTDGMAGPEPHRFAGIGVCDGNTMRTAIFRAVALWRIT